MKNASEEELQLQQSGAKLSIMLESEQWLYFRKAAAPTKYTYATQTHAYRLPIGGFRLRRESPVLWGRPFLQTATWIPLGLAMAFGSGATCWWQVPSSREGEGRKRVGVIESFVMLILVSI